MTRSRARVALGTVAAILAFAVLPAYAAAYPDTPKGALSDCGANDPLVGHYSVKVLQTALHDLTGSAADYSTCKDALEAALHAALLPHPKPHRTTPGTATRTQTTTTARPTTPANLAPPNLIANEIKAGVQSGGKPRPVSGRVVAPGAVVARDSSFFSTVPTPLLVVLGALLATAVALTVRATRNLVRARRPH